MATWRFSNYTKRAPLLERNPGRAVVAATRPPSLELGGVTRTYRAFLASVHVSSLDDLNGVLFVVHIKGWNDHPLQIRKHES
jgi:hypothetical protein